MYRAGFSKHSASGFMVQDLGTRRWQICFPFFFPSKLLETCWVKVFETRGAFVILWPLLNHFNSIKSYHYFIYTAY